MAPQVSPPTIRVAIIESHQVMAEGLCALMEREADLEVVGIATSVRDALTLAAEARPTVLVADMRLPDGTGAEAVGAIRRQHPSIRVLFLSDVSSPDGLMAAVQAGARGYLHKSQAAAEVIDAVRRISGGEMLIPATVLADLITLKGVQTHLIDRLTLREREVLHMLHQGLDNETLAGELGIGYGTVRTHVRSILAKLDVHSKLEAVARAAELGLLDTSDDYAKFQR